MSREHLTPFLQSADKFLSEELRYKRLRLLIDGLFIEENAENEFISGFLTWMKSSPEYGDKYNGPIPQEKDLYQKMFTDKQKREYHYLLDGKALLYGSILTINDIMALKSSIPVFRGSLLKTENYIHMKDKIFHETDDIKAALSSTGFHIEILSRKHSLKIKNSDILKILQILRESSSMLKKYPKLQGAARNVIPALVNIWKKAKVISKSQKLLIPLDLKNSKSHWFLLSGDIVFIQDSQGNFINAYGLKGRNLHNFLVEESEKLRGLKKRFPVKSFRTIKKGRALGSINFNEQAYFLDPICIRRFLERAPSSKNLPDKLPNRFTLFDTASQLLKILEKSKWIDSIHVPRTFSSQFPKGTNFRIQGNWYFALNKKKTIVGLHDKFNRNAGEKHFGLVGISRLHSKKSRSKNNDAKKDVSEKNKHSNKPITNSNNQNSTTPS